jgi:Protein of unknown function (DUF2785)
MELAFWERLVAGGHQPPEDHSLVELTADLTAMLGATDPNQRDAIAYSTLAGWITTGVYDDLLEGLGDGMASGLAVGLGQDRTDSVFRRSFSVLVLAECIGRDTKQHLVPAETILRWGDRIASWYVREQDLRGFVAGHGWAHAIAHGADALGVLAESEAMGRLELTVLLDVVADRLLLPTRHHFVHGEPDRIAMATMKILRRNQISLGVLDPWVARLAHGSMPGFEADDKGADPYFVAGNVQGYLRALHLQLALSANPPACRADLLLTVMDHLKRDNSVYLRQ